MKFLKLAKLFGTRRVYSRQTLPPEVCSGCRAKGGQLVRDRRFHFDYAILITSLRKLVCAVFQAPHLGNKTNQDNARVIVITSLLPVNQNTPIFNFKAVAYLGQCDAKPFSASFSTRKMKHSREICSIWTIIIKRSLKNDIEV